MDCERVWDDVLRVQSEEGGAWQTLVGNLDADGALSWAGTAAESERALHLQRKRWIVAMLNDAERNAAYARAIAVGAADAARRDERDEELHEDSSEGAASVAVVALDIGAGTGLLTMLAAKSPRVAHVIACEMEPAMLELASSHVAEAQLEARVTLAGARQKNKNSGVRNR